jgi:hypothetical protein
MSWIVSPASTCPPWEFRYTVTGSPDSVAIASSCEVTDAATFCVISPLTTMVRDRKSRSATGSNGSAWRSSD